MFDDKYLLNKNQKKIIMGGFTFWNFSIAFSLITSAVSNVVQMCSSIYNATQTNSANNYSSNKQPKNNSFIPYLDNFSPYVRLSKYPSKSTVGLFM